MRTLQQLEVSYLFKVSSHRHVRGQLGCWQENSRAEKIFEEANSVRSNSGRL